MLSIENSNISAKKDSKNTNSSSQIAFSSNLDKGVGMIRHLSENWRVIPEIERFKTYIRRDGKKFLAELSNDSFAKSSAQDYSREKFVRENAKHYNEIKRVVAAYASGDIHNPGSSEDIITHLSKETVLSPLNGAIKYNAMLSSGNIPEMQTSLKLINKFENSKEDKFLKNGAINAVRNLQDPAVRDKKILEYAESKDPLKRYGAARLAPELSDPAIAAEILRKLRNDEVQEIRVRAAKSAGMLSDVNLSLEMLREGIKSGDNFIQVGSGKGAGLIVDPKTASDFIFETLKNGKLNAKLHAVMSAPNINNPVISAQVLRKLSRHDDSFIRDTAIRSVPRLSDEKKAIDILRNVIKNTNDGGTEFSVSLAAEDIMKNREKSAKQIYRLKVSDGNKLIGQRKIEIPENKPRETFPLLKSTYDAIIKSTKSN